MKDYEQYLAGTQELINKTLKHEKVYTTVVCGHKFIVRPGVFSPQYFKDSELFAAYLPIVSGGRVLEIGPGTGVVSIMAAYRGAGAVVAIDINPQAVKNTQTNILKHSLEKIVTVRQGDVYSALMVDEKFDVVFWNVPFGLIPDRTLSYLERAVYDPEYGAITRYIEQAGQYLSPRGRLLIGFSKTLGKFLVLKKIARQFGYTIKTINVFKSQEVHAVTFEILELIKIQKNSR